MALDYGLLLLFISSFGYFEDLVCSKDRIGIAELNFLSQFVTPSMENKVKGDAGKICVVGGSDQYTGAPYFTAISALKAGADKVFILTTEEAAPAIRSHSPNYAVNAFLNINSVSKISALLQKNDVIVIGPGLSDDNDTLNLISKIIETCKALKKPIVIDAYALFAVSKYPSIIKNYPAPGVILTPNKGELDRLIASVPGNTSDWYSYWGEYVSVLVKGEQDRFISSVASYNWASSNGGSGRRVTGQGDILSGFLGTVFNWALKKRCGERHVQLSHSISAFAAAKLTRSCNYRAYKIHGRNMVASDMVQEIHNAFLDVFAQ